MVCDKIQTLLGWHNTLACFSALISQDASLHSLGSRVLISSHSCNLPGFFRLQDIDMHSSLFPGLPCPGLFSEPSFLSFSFQVKCVLLIEVFPVDLILSGSLIISGSFLVLFIVFIQSLKFVTCCCLLIFKRNFICLHSNYDSKYYELGTLNNNVVSLKLSFLI